jgi:putative peptidoglycan lipid II flippase
MKRWLPVVATASVFTINQQVAMRFASGLDDGSAAALGNALVFWQLPFGIFSASVTTVLFPQMSRQVAQSDTQGLVGSVNQGLRFLLVLLIPSSVVLTLLGKELIAVALQRGAFSEAGTRLAARTLIGYSVGLFCVGAFSFLQRLYYAQGDYRTPFYAAILVAIVDIALSLWWKETVLRVAGLAYANSASFTVGLVVLAIVARARLGPLGGRRALLTAAKVALAASAGGLFVAWYLWITGAWWAEGSTFRGLGLLVGAAAGYVAIVVGLYAAFRVDVFMMLVKRLVRR